MKLGLLNLKGSAENTTGKKNQKGEIFLENRPRVAKKIGNTENTIIKKYRLRNQFIQGQGQIEKENLDILRPMF